MSSAYFDLSLDDGRVEAHIATLADDTATEIGEHILAVSNQHVPIEEGTLERSGVVSEPEGGEVVVSYDTPYAVVQHEDLTFVHDQGRTAKYLENAFHSEAGAVEQIAAGGMHL